MKIHTLGFPRIGDQRQLKKAVEAYWQGLISNEQLKEEGAQLRRRHWQLQQEVGIDLIPSNDFSFYDQVLDTSCLFGMTPERFSNKKTDLDDVFEIARGLRPGEDISQGSQASEMTKWFDTNYHYIVPEVHQKTTLRLCSDKIISEFIEAKNLGIITKPVLVGPVTLLSLAKSQDQDINPLDLLPEILPLYSQVIAELEAQGCEWLQLDEPIFSLDLSADQKAALQSSYDYLAERKKDLSLIVANYFGELRDNKEAFLTLPVEVLHIDGVRAASEVSDIANSLASDKILSLGIIDGRNIWKNDYKKSLEVIESVRQSLGENRLWLAPSCSLLHVPVSLALETSLDENLKNSLAFAEEKLQELTDLKKLAHGDALALPLLTKNKEALKWRRESDAIHNPLVKKACEEVVESDLKRKSNFKKRQEKQNNNLSLPAFPTTTIGSFPQTKEVRRQRALLKKNQLAQSDYDNFIAQEITDSIRFQEECGIDMLVHGEFERNDMVEYFGEKLQGFAFTNFAWVQSYGSRCVKPPIIYGDVIRPEAMTLKWTSYAKSLTDKPVKGMLTGPVTILQWSFVRDDQPRSETTKQIALAIREEVIDLEKAGIDAIQIDEPALREGLPLRQSDYAEYLKWSVDAFRLATAAVEDTTQIHTHMCYCEFHDILDSVAALDADVISIETSRSKMELLDAFADFSYPNGIGPGVYDIHSPRVPAIEEMRQLLDKARDVIPAENLWVNPDCGLKTRDWPEVKRALENMVAAARALRI